jgi:hypothetical protein
MADDPRPDEITSPVEKPRPVFLTALCLFSMVYFGIFSILFLAGLFKLSTITRVMDQYLSTGAHAMPPAAWIFGAGFFLHALALAGVVMIWRLRRPGYYFLGISCLAIAVLQMINPTAAVSSTAIYVIYILIFGIFYRRLK